MRIVHLVAGNMFGGVERLVTVLMHPAFQQGMRPSGGNQGHMESHVAICFEGHLSAAVREMGIEPVMLGGARLSRPWTLWAVRRRLEVLLDELCPDVVIFHGCWPHVIGAGVARRHGAAVVFWAHQIMTGGHWLERLAGRVKPDLAICASHAVREGVAPVFGETPTTLLRCAVMPPELLDELQVRSDIRRSLRTAEDEVVILLPARFDGCKGHPVLVEALGKLSKNRNSGNWQCWIAGAPHGRAETRYAEALKARVASLGLESRVKFLGHRRDVPRLMAAADIFCQPNVGPESFGIAFIEAMGAGLPVVTSALGGALELVDETCGLLLPPGDVEALANELLRLIQDEPLRHRLGEGGPVRALKLCNPPDRMRELELILKETLATDARNTETIRLAAGKLQKASS